MCSFDFDTPTERRGTGSLKWDVAPGELPMWVADMDFPTAPAVRRAVMEVAERGIYGYAITPRAYFESVAAFRERRHGVQEDPDHMIFVTGVVAAISSAVRKLTTPAEKVLIQAPVYNIFYNSILNNGRQVISSDLIYRGGRYSVDFEDLEAKLADPQTSLMILCNPHNPVGRIWQREELSRVGELAARYGVTVLSDEIHGDLTAPGRDYVPFAAASETCRRISVTCLAASKTFNLAGVQAATVLVDDPILRHRMWRGINTDEVGEPNVFAMAACMAAYREGDAWLDALRVYLEENKQTVRTRLAAALPQLYVVPSEATYLLWIDISAVCEDSVAFTDFLRRQTGLYLSDGAEYGAPGRSFVRMNVATCRSRVEDGVQRLIDGVNRWVTTH